MKKHLLTLVSVLLLLCMLFPMSATATDAVAEEDASETVFVVILKVDKAKGEKILLADVEAKEMKNVNIPPDALRNINEVTNKFAAEPLYAGEYVRKEQLSSSRVIESDPRLLVKNITKSGNDFVVVTDYVIPNTGENLQTHLQAIIDKNPLRTIYFPDGEYVISSPLLTSAVGGATTTFCFADGAVLKASDAWSSQGTGQNALICLGGKKAANDNRSVGSYYGIFGGTFDGNGMADGISVDSGRESIIRGCKVINAKNGIYIKTGANNGSSDADIEDVIIDGKGLLGSVGLRIVGYDNTFTDVKIYDVEKGVIMNSGGNALRNIEVRLTDAPHCEGLKKRYQRLIGIECISDSFYYQCYVENYATAYSLTSDRYQSNYDSCDAAWTYAAPVQTAFSVNGNFVSRLSNCRVQFFDATSENAYLKSSGGNSGIIEAAQVDTSLLDTPIPPTTLKPNAVINISGMGKKD